MFWVFGTDVMVLCLRFVSLSFLLTAFATQTQVTVAKSFDAPIKLLFPRDILAAQYKFSMLGLGDIVIPGVFIALLLRFDRARANDATHFARPYFNATFVGYVVGLVTTIVVMHVFKAAQPALLYLVPACIGCSLFTAVARNELVPLFAYSEEEQAKAATEEKQK